MDSRISRFMDGRFVLDESASEVFDLPITGRLAVILCHFNPCSYQAPVKNLRIVLNWLSYEKLPTFAIELRCGRSLSEAPALPDHPRVLHLDSQSVMFRKDNLWDVIATRVPEQFGYILCIDADTILIGENWKERLVKALERFKAVQPFSKAIWLDSLGNPFKEKMSCAYGYCNCLSDPQVSKNFHSGFCIALQRDFWTVTSGFFNSPIGGGSLFLISALLGVMNELEPSLAEISPPLLNYYREWATRVFLWAGGSLGYIENEALHIWHGSRKKRRYLQRFEALRSFDPSTDISFSREGIHEWSESSRIEKPDLIRRVEDYFHGREEDEHWITGGNQND